MVSCVASSMWREDFDRVSAAHNHKFTGALRESAQNKCLKVTLV